MSPSYFLLFPSIFRWIGKGKEISEDFRGAALRSVGSARRLISSTRPPVLPLPNSVNIRFRQHRRSCPPPLLSVGPFSVSSSPRSSPSLSLISIQSERKTFKKERKANACVLERRQRYKASNFAPPRTNQQRPAAVDNYWPSPSTRSSITSIRKKKASLASQRALSSFRQLFLSPFFGKFFTRQRLRVKGVIAARLLGRAKCLEVKCLGGRAKSPEVEVERSLQRSRLSEAKRNL